MSPPPQQHEVNAATVAGAVAALAKWMRARTEAAPPNLLTDERDDVLLLQLSLRRVPASPTNKPRLIALPHPVLPEGSASICVITDDRPKSSSPAASDLLDAAKSHGLPVSEAIPLSTLRTDYRPYESRRRLAASHDLFIADRAVLPLLPRVLGKAFYSTKKAPLGADFTRAGWPEQLRKVLSSTFLYLRSGTCSGIKVGRLDMKEDDIVENVMAAVAAAVEKVPKKWANVRALHLKAVDSVALPIYQVVPELGLKIEVPVPVGRLEGATGAGEVIDAAQVVTGVKGKNKKKKAFRYSDADGGEEAEKELSGKRKRNNKDQSEDVVMEEEVQDKTDKRKKVKGVAAVEVPSDAGQEVAKKSKRKSKRTLDTKVDDSSAEKKKGKKNDHAVEEAISKKKKGKKEDINTVEVETDARESIKSKKGGIKDDGKKSKKGKDDGEVIPDEKSSKGKNEKRKLRSRVRV